MCTWGWMVVSQIWPSKSHQKKNLKRKKPKSSGHQIWFLTLDLCVTLDANIWRPLTPTLWRAKKPLNCGSVYGISKRGIKKFWNLLSCVLKPRRVQLLQSRSRLISPPSNGLFPLQTTFSDLICLSVPGSRLRTVQSVGQGLPQR